MVVSCFCICHNHQKNLIETETKKTLDEEDIVKKVVFTSLLNTLELQVQQHFFLNKGSSQL